MGREIEKKFLVNDCEYKKSSKGILLRQGYLNSNHERVVRVRTFGSEGFITIKGKNVGATRPEYEYKIPYNEAEEILEGLCEKPLLEKYRYTLDYQGFTWEVDEFLGDNNGLIIAEIELEDENTDFQKPDWIGKEVTGDARYYNSNLISNPYKNWV